MKSYAAGGRQSRRRVANDQDVRPLLLDSPTGTGVGFGKRHGVPARSHRMPLGRMEVRGPNRQRNHSSDVDENEAMPLMSSDSLLGNSPLLGMDRGVAGDSHQQDIHFHAPKFQAATRARTPTHRRHVHGQYNDHRGVIRNKNPAKDLAGLCSYGCCCIQCVRTNEVGVLHTFGQFQRLLKPGLICMIWPCTRLGRLSLRINQLDITCETKTKDNVFVTLGLAVQYRVLSEHAFEAYYSLQSPQKQLSAFVFDVVRSTIPRMDVDDVFTQKEEIALDVLRSLQSMMHRYGYDIMETLVTHISPADLVKDAMNEINAAKRIKEAMPHRGEAEKIMKVKAAEAYAETLHLQGIGLANARKAIASGMKKSLLHLDSDNITPKDVMDLLLVSQYMDTLHAVGASSAILHHSPQEVVEFQDQIADYFLPPHGSSAAVENTSAMGIPDLLS